MDWKHAWGLQESFTLKEAVLLACEINPHEAQKDSFEYPDVFSPLLKNITKYLLRIESEERESEGSTLTWRAKINPETELIDRDNLLKWYEESNIRPSVFYSKELAVGYRAYLDESHPHYSKKLAACILAWEALASDPALLKGRTPKEAAIKWISKRAEELALAEGKDSEIPGQWLIR
ncbi:MAG: hypothetical protein ACXW30_05655 [Micavibrio sp.]